MSHDQMKTVFRRLGWLALGLVIVGAVVYVWIGFVVYTSFGPRDPPTAIIEPTTIGLVDDVIYDDDILRLRLDGSPMTLDPDAHLVLAKPHDGELLLLGIHEDRPWYLAIPDPAPSDPDGCYWLANRAWNERDAILFDVGGDYASGRLGLRLPKADGFRTTSSGAEPDVYSRTDWFCVGVDGAVAGTIEGLRRAP